MRLYGHNITKTLFYFIYNIINLYKKMFYIVCKVYKLKNIFLLNNIYVTYIFNLFVN